MFSDYVTLVMQDYEKKRGENKVPPGLIHLSRAQMREDCIATCENRYSRKTDEIALQGFFGKGYDKGDALIKIKESVADKFRPLEYFLKGKTKEPGKRIIELLAWLIDFDQRPYELGKKYAVVETPPAEPGAADEGDADTVEGMDSPVQMPLQPPGEEATVAGEAQAAAADGQEMKPLNRVDPAGDRRVPTPGEPQPAVTNGGNKVGEEKEKTPEVTPPVADTEGTLTGEPQHKEKNNIPTVYEPGPPVTDPVAHSPAPPQKKKYLKTVAWPLALVMSAGISYFALKKDGCMYWAGDHYERVSCDEDMRGVLVIPADAAKLNWFKKITRPDTLTRSDINRVFYVKLNGILEYFTAGGFHPVYLTRDLKPLSDHIYETHVEPMKAASTATPAIQNSFLQPPSGLYDTAKQPD